MPIVRCMVKTANVSQFDDTIDRPASLRIFVKCLIVLHITLLKQHIFVQLPFKVYGHLLYMNKSSKSASQCCIGLVPLEGLVR